MDQSSSRYKANHRLVRALTGARWLPLWLVFVIVGQLSVAGESADVDRVASEIDRLISARWDAENVTPAPMASDAEFLRRVSLDIRGKIPHGSEVRDFLDDTSPTKRSEIVERFLDSPSYVIHATNLWRAAMIPEADGDPLIRSVLPGFEAWLRSRIAENRNFAEIVTEMLTLPVTEANLQGRNQPDRPTPAAFYTAKEAKPERLAAATARLFLGMRIDCAQCHDHPFDDWKQQQFWELAAFFTDLSGNRNREPTASEDATSLGVGTIAIPETDRTATMRFLEGEVSVADDTGATRPLLANWIVDAENPYFAKAAVNRIWSYFFGIGLVDPMDDFSASNPATHPELLDLLAQEFRQHDFDFKFMIRAITASRTYQLTSRQTDPSQADRRLYARANLRGLSPEQIFDSLAQAVGHRQPFDPELPLNFNNDRARQEFVTTFANQSESAPDRSSTILQALTLMNGSFLMDATDLTRGRTLSAIVDAPFLDTAEKVDALYLSTLSRFPGEKEKARFVSYIDQGGSLNDSQSAVSDVFWTLLNSSEFLLNH